MLPIQLDNFHLNLYDGQNCLQDVQNGPQIQVKSQYSHQSGLDGHHDCVQLGQNICLVGHSCQLSQDGCHVN